MDRLGRVYVKPEEFKPIQGMTTLGDLGTASFGGFKMDPTSSAIGGVEGRFIWSLQEAVSAAISRIAADDTALSGKMDQVVLEPIDIESFVDMSLFAHDVLHNIGGWGTGAWVVSL